MNFTTWLSRIVPACALALALAAGAHAATVADAPDAAKTLNTPQFDKCMDGAGGVTTAMVNCIQAEIGRQDAVLNSNYKQAMQKLNAARRQSLQKAQRAWLAFRDAQCTFEFDPDGGTIAHVESTDCVRSMTAERAHYLGTVTQ